jgi:DNA polymerase-3 subunit alpha
MYGALEFYKEARKSKIKPIIGCEVYVAKRSRLKKEIGIDSKNYHLVLLCKNFTGYQNLLKLVSRSFIEGFYNKPRVDDKLLEKYSEGLVALSGCLAGKIQKFLLQNNHKEARETALFYKKIFGKNNFFLELQDHNLEEQKTLNYKLQKLAKELDISLVATNDCHYPLKEDEKAHRALLCIQTGTTLSNKNKFSFKSNEFYIKSSDEMKLLFSDVPEALRNTSKIADMCNLKIDFGKAELPNFSLKNSEIKDHFLFLKQKCYKGLHKNYQNDLYEILSKRLEYELCTIRKMGYVDYFLIVSDFVDFAKSKHIPVGPGRGSGCGSLAAFCLGITGIDPIKYGLLFERFLNPERISMPDFDIDFCFARRSEVINYVIEKYDKSHVAQIITFGTMAAKLAVRDVGRVLSMPYSYVDSIAKLIPSELGITLSQALKTSQKLKKIYLNRKDVKELIDIALKIEGMPRHASIHAAGIVITKRKLDECVPLAKLEDTIVTQYAMKTLESIGLLKIDFLGLRTLTIINDCQNMIRKSCKNKNFDIMKDISPVDEDTYKMLTLGNTQGVFQFESPGMTSILMRLHPNKLEDLIAVISLHRPGPMAFIPVYIENKHNPNKITYKTPALKEILEVTYGCIVYQEQVMQIFRKLAGYSFSRADIIRRAISKKEADVLRKEREVFIFGEENAGKISIDGCIRRGIEKNTANEIFDSILSFASYAFNKSHATAYALIAYRTAYLKCKFPPYYMSSLLTNALGNTDKIAKYIAECTRIKLKVLPPCVNESEKSFVADGNKIRFGLLAIKNLGPNIIKIIIDERKISGKFDSFYDFCDRVYNSSSGKFNKKALESLVKCGALDIFNTSRKKMLNISQKILDILNTNKKYKLDGQISFFSNENFIEQNSDENDCTEEFDKKTLLRMEKEVMGLYLSSHPIAPFKDKIEQESFTKINVIKNNLNKKIKVLAVIEQVKLKRTKLNQTMAFLKIEDFESNINVIIFPDLFKVCNNCLKQSNIIEIMAKVSLNYESKVCLIAETINLIC